MCGLVQVEKGRVQLKHQSVKHTRRYAAAILITLSIFSLLIASGFQRPGFFMEYGAIKAGTWETPWIYVRATKTKDRYDSIEVKGGGELRYAVRMSGRCPEDWRLSSGSLAIYGDG